MSSCLSYQRTTHTGVVLAWWDVGGTGDNQPSAPVSVHQQPGPEGCSGQRVSRAAQQAVLQEAFPAVGSGQGHGILQLLQQGCQERRRRHHRRPSLRLCQRWAAYPAIQTPSVRSTFNLKQHSKVEHSRQHAKRSGFNQSVNPSINQFFLVKLQITSNRIPNRFGQSEGKTNWWDLMGFDNMPVAYAENTWVALMIQIASTKCHSWMWQQSARDSTLCMQTAHIERKKREILIQVFHPSLPCDKIATYT